MDTSITPVGIGAGAFLAGGLLMWYHMSSAMDDIKTALKRIEQHGSQEARIEALVAEVEQMSQGVHPSVDKDAINGLTERLKASLRENAALKSQIKKGTVSSLEPDRFKAGAESAVDVVMDRTMRKSKVFRVVLTGGPCAGKTTALARMTEHFKSEGWRVYAVPEAATMLFTGGIMREELCSTEAVYQFQTNMLKIMMTVEEAFLSMARASGSPSIIFCDRGTMDASAYMEKNLWQAMLDENGWTEVSIRDNRYDCVVHMVSAAVDAPEFYTTDNNAARNETPEEAREVERRLSRCWVGHPYLVVIKTVTNFEDKLNRAINVVSSRAAGKVEVGYCKRKFLVKQMPHDSAFKMPFDDFDVEYTFLLNADGTTSRLRKRGKNGSYTYTHMLHDETATQQTITGREYVALLANRDTSRQPVLQKQRFFVYKYRCYYLAEWLAPRRICVLQVYARIPCAEGGEEEFLSELPAFISIDQEITKNPDYKMLRLAAMDT